jgi:hypothetical protein
MAQAYRGDWSRMRRDGEIALGAIAVGASLVPAGYVAQGVIGTVADALTGGVGWSSVLNWIPGLGKADEVGEVVGDVAKTVETLKNTTDIPNLAIGLTADATKGGFSVNPSKFDYFFGRVVSGSEHNIARSAQNLKDLTTLGIKSESQLMNVFGQALESGTVISTKTSQYGTTVMRSVNIGNQGSINVGFFYQGGNMSVTPSVSTIIPKIFK